MSLLLLGAGQMAAEYSKVLTSLQQNYTVVGRSVHSAALFQEQTGKKVIANGLEKIVEDGSIRSYHAAIVAVSENMLGTVTRQLIENGIQKILVEKPGGLSIEDIESVNSFAKQYKAKVYVGYNRRFYASVIKAKEIIANDSGVSSFNFEFTEWGHVIEALKKGEGIKEEWFLANSTHVIDLAFYLGGRPKVLTSYVSGTLPWHSRGASFAGAGISESEALFSYSANWSAPGRWGLEILTNKHRLYLRPMEKLQIQNIGEVVLRDVEIDDQLDIEFKPGLFNQVKAFLNDEGCLLTINEQCAMLKHYKKIRGDR